MEGSKEVNSSLWVFGYGSLIWKTNFPYEDKVLGHVKGYKRRFWQGSVDHRGIPGAPGRVVTLLKEAEEETWGVAFKVKPHDVPEVIAYLDHRERGGYTTHEILFYPHKDSKIVTPFTTLAYIATESNSDYLGPASTEDLAKQIVDSRGDSGCNNEYVLKLADSVRTFFPFEKDKHLFDLDNRIRGIIKERIQTKLGLSADTDISGIDFKRDEKCTCGYCICKD